jgi:hypothetical protein
MGASEVELIRQVARASREIAAIPGPRDPRPAPPGRNPNPLRTPRSQTGDTDGGLAGEILADFHRADEPGQETPPSQQEGKG